MSIRVIDAYRTEVSDQWNHVAYHSAPFARLYVSVKGKGRLRFRGQERELLAGRCFLIPSNEVLELISSPGFDHYWVHFNARCMGGRTLFDLAEYDFEYIPPNRHDLAVRMALVRDILRLTEENTPAAEFRLYSLMLEFLGLFVKDWRGTSDSIAAMGQLTTVMTYIENNLNGPISVETLAGIAHLHPNYFSNVFRDAVGMPPKAYVLQKRIEQAQTLLWNSDESLKTIARNCGFDDPCYFSRIFRKKTGQTPGNFRKGRELYDSLRNA